MATPPVSIASSRRGFPASPLQSPTTCGATTPSATERSVVPVPTPDPTRRGRGIAPAYLRDLVQDVKQSIVSRKIQRLQYVGANS